MTYYELEQKLVNNVEGQTALLKDVALSLKILSGRMTLKEMRLEQELEVLRMRLSDCHDIYPNVSDEQQEILKEIDEVMEEIKKERGKE